MMHAWPMGQSTSRAHTPSGTATQAPLTVPLASIFRLQYSPAAHADESVQPPLATH